MAAKHRKVPPVSLASQVLSIKSKYGPLIEFCSISNSRLSCCMSLRPAPDCEEYRILIHYKISDYSPKVWLLSPELQRVNGKRPHHIYDYDYDGHPRLCVYYPGYSEWNQHMLISDSFIPWIITWLNTYEYWLITGQWLYDESPSVSKKGK